MEYIIAGLRLSLPDSLIPPRFAEALQAFAVAGTGAAREEGEGREGREGREGKEEAGRARTARSEVAPEEAFGRARAAGIEVAPGEAAGRARAARSEVAPEEAFGRTRAAGPEVAPGEAVARARAAGVEVAPKTCSGPELILESAARIQRAAGWHELHRFNFTDADADCRFGCDQAGFLLEMSPRDGSLPAQFRIPEQGLHACCDFTPAHHPALFRFGLWTLFNLTALHRNAVAIHASTIRYRGRGILFLGESGTGKSTHSRLWRENIPGSALLNDDSPILGLADGTVRVWGSPWSGKVPCYRNESCPVAAIVRLVQAPENRIRRLSPIEAFGALFPSTPPAFIRDTRLQDAVCTLLGQIIGLVPVYRLECRPDAEAARLACENLFGAPLSPLRPGPENPDRPCR